MSRHGGDEFVPPSVVAMVLNIITIVSVKQVTQAQHHRLRIYSQFVADELELIVSRTLFRKQVIRLLQFTEVKHLRLELELSLACFSFTFRFDNPNVHYSPFDIFIYLE